MNEEKTYDLEDRLIRFAVMIANLAETLPDTMFGRYIAGQIIRSACSPALNYGEAQSAESLNDFIHKMKICLKELRETQVSLKITQLKPLVKNTELLTIGLKECNELIAIFVKSIQTSEKRKTQK
ncbi:MAG: four helix bundle protein [Bacteroidetes bacterium]|nr:four helix bundle protein [Bacteroidota bacterium]